jgi:LysM repeat protein
LAQRYGVRLRTLAKLNGLRINSHLRQGQRLLIPDGASNPSSRSAAD